jgi:hypothetical protein
MISGQATPTIEDTYGSLVSANANRRSGFRSDVSSFIKRSIFILVSYSVLVSYRLTGVTVIGALSLVCGMEAISLQEPTRVL